ncbi:hypothetical protein EK21DRAFT_83537 [Setomelanomma holmii]|uniref:Uncharacterized protein n=1 Tax=Setomelanomma holmii TaxID=210430 RepID=A0A9P4HM90_9PLEO|nr:hypothetical protein EK21DRAFT_83537 [Setomelanomma holmii]
MPKAMAHAPESNYLTPYSTISSADEVDARQSQSPPDMATSYRSTRKQACTQYAFIMQTGDESSTTVKKKLKTVRSHVMKNYLHQQQQRRSIEDLLETDGNKTRRKSKDRRRSRSASPNVTLSVNGQTGKGVLTSAARNDSKSAFHFLGPFFDVNVADFTNQAVVVLLSTSVAACVCDITSPTLTANCFAGRLHPSCATLNAKVDTVRSVKDTLALCDGRVPPQAIFAVTLLAYGCAISTEWMEAHDHADVLVCLVDSIGGMQALEFDLQRSVAWITYSVAAVLNSAPAFLPPLCQEHGVIALSLFDDAQMKAWRTMKRFPKDNAFVYDVVVRMHRLSLATSSEWHGKVDWRALSNLHFEAMHKVLSTNAERPWRKLLSESARGDELSTMFEVWTLALPLFVWATTRQLSSGLGVNTPWSGHDSIIFRIQACSFASPWRPWLLRVMRKAIKQLKLKELEDFRKSLEFFPSTDAYRLVAESAWTEITQAECQTMAPAMTPSTRD